MLLMIGATVGVALIVGLFCTSWIFGVSHPFYAVLATVVYACIMGGAVSCTRRLGDVSTKGDALGSIRAEE